MATVKTTNAMVMTGRRRSELRELPVPPTAADAGLLLVEAAGVCGSDVGFYDKDLSPRVLGHENVGTITELGSIAARRWGVGEGDRVVLEEYLPCGHCDFCRSSEFRLCMESDASANPNALRYGSTPLTVAPALWGGFSQYLYLHPNTVAHRLAPGVSAVEASLALPLANGYEWAYVEGRTRPGDVVVIIGPGQQGLGCVLAAKQAGAGKIIITGQRRDTARLEVATRLGADATLYADDDDLVGKIRELTSGQMADLVIDTAAGSESTISLALDLARKRGRIVVPATSMRPLRDVEFYKITRKYLTVQGVRGHSYGAVEWAIALISSGEHPLDQMCSLEVGLTAADQAILGTAGELDVPVIHAAVVPSGE
jgi:threonine dehydrogenase-like Zn-dependent dehydrogenase